MFPGENEVEQLACIMEILGLPPNIVLEQATRRRLFFGKLTFYSQIWWIGPGEWAFWEGVRRHKQFALKFWISVITLSFI